ncbi:MAG: hypothetical protein ACREX6_00370, partial [Casimicrobiaceae bacterium]
GEESPCAIAMSAGGRTPASSTAQRAPKERAPKERTPKEGTPKEGGDADVNDLGKALGKLLGR